MEKSKVYFTDFRTNPGVSIQDKLKKLMIKAGFKEMDLEDKYVAIKIHFGEPGNLAYLRPNYAKTVVDMVREANGRPFLTDCNTLYVGGRKNALDHMDSAYGNGYNPFVTGCHVVIADGLKGTDEALVPVVGGEYVKEAKIGQAIMDADVIIAMTHYKSHGMTGIGGAIKNVGMGCGSRAGKMEMHSNGKPIVAQEKCIGCGMCIRNCAHDAITITDKKASINTDKCVGCGRCIGACPKDAVKPMNDAANDVLCRKMAEYTKAVVDGRPCFYINFVMDVSPLCDCLSCNDVPIVPDVGIFAGFDPIALDQACLDAVNEQEPVENSALGEALKLNPDSALGHFAALHPDAPGEVMLEHGEKLGLGSREYELIKI